ncbi:hypothetical protein INT46_006775 [Mucor plumbeus]|uniref:Uncharacterized protein n=1 Tax=Mucor plumbeus TaxID=97098 RepID=A0A8H7RRU3_9FUNG|nr:hypothetical protein INT46_006775 [Mucor plumbeus]
MTIEVPPTATTAVVEEFTHTKTSSKDLASGETKTEEPTLSIQIEPPTTNNPEDLTLSNEEKPTSAKLKALFNNPFKITKKETTAETSTTTADIPRETANAEEKAAATASAAAATATGITTGTGENKITKGLGNLYTKIKQTASSHNIKDIAGTSPPPVTTSTEQPIAEDKEYKNAAAAVEKKTTSSSSSSSSSSEEGDAPLHESEAPSASTNQSNTNKRQSLLSKLFGGGAKKKEEEHTDTVEPITREVNTSTQESETTTPSAAAVDPESEERSLSPPLSRRVTGFFAKKIPSYNKKHQKSNDKTENTSEERAAIDTTKDVIETEVVSPEVSEPTNNNAIVAATAATGVTTAETTTNKDVSLAPVTTSA